MKIYFLEAAITWLFCTQSISAQRQDANRLFFDAKYTEAATLLQQQIKKARKQNQSTTILEAALQRARIGENMILHADTVVCSDTIVIDRTQLFSALELSNDIGTLLPAVQLFPEYAARLGNSAYINGWGDIAYFSMADSSGLHNLYRSLKINDKWTSPQPLPGLQTTDKDRDFPFMSTDGTTLYFAEQGATSLGGFDLFITRYDFHSHKFLKPEQLRIPYNSPYNDLLYIKRKDGSILLVTDRNQPADKLQILTLKKINKPQTTFIYNGKENL